MSKLLDTSAHSRLHAGLMEDDEYRNGYEQSLTAIRAIDRVINQLDSIREEAGISKAALARAIDRNPSSVRRLFTQRSNPELALVAQIAAALGAQLEVVPPKKQATKRTRTRTRELVAS